MARLLTEMAHGQHSATHRYWKEGYTIKKVTACYVMSSLSCIGPGPFFLEENGAKMVKI
jgi:hypothetical protein